MKAKNNVSALENRWILWGILVIFALGSGMHFVYEWTGENRIIGMFVPVNESIWEHTKLVLLPMIVWWGMFLPFKRYAPMWNWNRWCTACIIALIISIILIPLLYYFYSEAFGVHLLVIDILILLIAIGCGQLAARHYYCHANGASAWMGLLVILFILSVFAYWTFFTPHLPLFYDKSKGIYGYGLLISF